MRLSSLMLAAVCTFGLAGCATAEFKPGVQLPNQQGVRVLYEYPENVKYKAIGTVDAYVYKPGWSAPTVSDAMPKLIEKAAAAGGNALIVRNSQVGQFERSISVTAEVLTVDWPTP